MKDKILVSGASGTVGRQVVSELLEMKQQVIVLTRDKKKSTFPKEVDVFEGYLSKPQTLSGLFKDVVAAHFIAFSGEDYVPLDTGYELVKMMAEENVRRTTVLWNGEGKAGTMEKAVMASEPEWTILEPQEYMSNALGWAGTIRKRRLVEEPCIDRPTAAIHENDLGAVIAHILVYGGHNQKIYTLTGPEVLTPRKQVGEIAKALKSAITIHEITEAEARKRWASLGLQEETMDYLYEWYSNTPADGYTVNHLVTDIIGKPQKTFKEWVEFNLHAFE